MNVIMIIKPYWKHGTWVFSDETTGLVDEPFVSGIDTIISILVADIPNAKEGFKATFSGSFFPGYTDILEFMYPDEHGAGNYYRYVIGKDNEGKEVSIKGWLCPALKFYFQKAPEKIYCKVEAL